jgi:aminocarboxymuconate-semialdehyde decarboxylase
MPALIGRWDHGATVRSELKHMSKPPSSYLRRFHYDTITHSGPILTNLIEQVGADRVMMGSDCPADMSYTQPVRVVEGLEKVSAGDRDKILGANAARLLRL